MEKCVTKAAYVFNAWRGIQAAIYQVTAIITFLSPPLYTNNGVGSLPVRLPAFYHSYILLFACKPKNPV
jgi:hypothetical protein